jgi:hypothetical protein
MTLASSLRLCAVLALPLAAGCTQPQRPYTFSAPTGADSTTDVLARALEAEGRSPTEVDPERGIIRTRWDDQGYCQTPQQTDGHLVRRFIVVMTPAASGSSVTVRADVQCCVSAEVSVDGRDVQGPCIALPEVFEQHQREVDALGAALQQALARAGQ